LVRDESSVFVSSESENNKQGGGMSQTIGKGVSEHNKGDE
jgi:hypothetical protein